ncbi:uncharacterized protein LOC118348424 [Juglans regia]|uniref:Uncharacterized protein LOC118348424 n=1 Tax=Juglans regia TaxID=51240 RepID=A0A6P9ETP6_JUGRE|nr:uncharacterized protein LOC118348424 [Juglans regia]
MKANSVGKGYQENEEVKKLHHNVCSLIGKYEELAKKIGTSSSVDQLLFSTNLPFSAKIMTMPLTGKFKVPSMDLYDGSKDPVEHFETFKAHMTLHRFSEEIMCRAFLLTLKGSARGWFGALQPNFIESFEKLGLQFLTMLMASRKSRRPTAYLLTVKQREDESLKEYLTRFNKTKMTADDQYEKIMLAALLGGVWPRHPFMAELARKTPSILREFMDRTDDFVNAEDTLIALTTQQERSEWEHKGGQKKDRDGGPKAKKDQH